MRKIATLLFALVLLSNTSWSQAVLVNYDHELNRFGENQPLPAEKNMIVQGQIPDAIELVELSIYHYKDKPEEDEPLYRSTWKKSFDKSGGKFLIPVNFKLQASRKYDLLLRYYRPASPAERDQLYEAITENINFYVEHNFVLDDDEIDIRKRPRRILRELNNFAFEQYDRYRFAGPAKFKGFSSLIAQRIESYKELELPEDSTRQIIFKEEMQTLKNRLKAEVKMAMQSDLMILTEQHYVNDYETEDRKGYFALNAGYGAVYLGGNIENLDYGASPYIGFAVPLSTSGIAPRFFRNTSLTFGVFTNNFENDDGEKVSGPIFTRPFYLGLDYKLFQFIRFNAGATLLETEILSGIDDTDNKITIEPFIGISAKVNLSISLDK